MLERPDAVDADVVALVDLGMGEHDGIRLQICLSAVKTSRKMAGKALLWESRAMHTTRQEWGEPEDD